MTLFLHFLPEILQEIAKYIYLRRFETRKNVLISDLRHPFGDLDESKFDNFNNSLAFVSKLGQKNEQ